VVSDVQLFSIPGLSCLFHYLLSLLRKGRQGQDLQPTIVIVRRTAEMKVPLASFMASRIVCISATLYGAVETLEVKESISRQLSNHGKKRTDYQYCYLIESQVALSMHQRGTCALYNQQDIVTNVAFN
jgi:hypothetical protein